MRVSARVDSIEYFLGLPGNEKDAKYVATRTGSVYDFRNLQRTGIARYLALLRNNQ